MTYQDAGGDDALRRFESTVPVEMQDVGRIVERMVGDLDLARDFWDDPEAATKAAGLVVRPLSVGMLQQVGPDVVRGLVGYARGLPVSQEEDVQVIGPPTEPDSLAPVVAVGLGIAGGIAIGIAASEFYHHHIAHTP